MRLNRPCLIDRQHDSRILHIRIDLATHSHEDPATRSHIKVAGPSHFKVATYSHLNLATPSSTVAAAGNRCTCVVAIPSLG